MYRRCGFRYEKKLRAIGVIRIAGIDEAGRGALAGPVVAAAVVLPEKFRHRKLNDSKQLAPEVRETIYDELVSNTEITWAVGIVDHIDQQPRQIHAGKLCGDLVFREGGHERIEKVPSQHGGCSRRVPIHDGLGLFGRVWP